MFIGSKPNRITGGCVKRMCVNRAPTKSISCTNKANLAKTSSYLFGFLISCGNLIGDCVILLMLPGISKLEVLACSGGAGTAFSKM